MTNLILIGYRGTGKTTVGRLLAEELGWNFVDADDEVERVAGKSIADIFSADGEEAFRDMEQQVVGALCQREQHVISLGGGAILRSENRDAMQRAGTVVWLTAAPATIQQRLCADDATRDRRPNLTQQGGLEEIETVLKQREALYRACADLEIDTDGVALADVSAKILSDLTEVGLRNPP